MNHLDTPLSEAEFDQLDEFLMSEAAPSDTMDSSMLDGYLAAVSSGPNLVMPDQMLRWVWDTEAGQESPQFETSAQAQTIVGLIMRHYQHVNDTFNTCPLDYEPRILERHHNGKVIPIIDEWCAGYYAGIAADMQAWTPMLVSRPELFATILLYGTADGWQTLKEKKLTDVQHESAANSLADSARQIHAFWLNYRRQQISRGETPGIMRKHAPVRNPAKVGRNDPCPCGSGKKFKHCHGGFGADGRPASEKRWLH